MLYTFPLFHDDYFCLSYLIFFSCWWVHCFMVFWWTLKSFLSKIFFLGLPSLPSYKSETFYPILKWFSPYESPQNILIKNPETIKHFKVEKWLISSWSVTFIQIEMANVSLSYLNEKVRDREGRMRGKKSVTNRNS